MAKVRMDIGVSTWPDMSNHAILRITEYCDRPHIGNITLTEDNARILSAAFLMYETLKKSHDFITPADEAAKAGMDALDIAEGTPGKRWARYLEGQKRKSV